MSRALRCSRFIGVGTPRGLQGRLAALIALALTVRTAIVDLWRLAAAHVADFTHRYPD